MGTCDREVYAGISRQKFPDWIGWLIVDLLNEDTTGTQDHRDEIQIQLDYEVKLFRYENIHPKRH